MEKSFDPNGYAVKNGNFIGLPFQEKDAQIVLLPVPWEATVSYAKGTAKGPQNILEASYQLDLYDRDVADAWKLGIFFQTPSPIIQELSDKSRKLAEKHISHLESGLKSDQHLVEQVNKNSDKLNRWVYRQSKKLLQTNKLVALIGGEHSIPYGYLWALSEHYKDFGILQIDAHCDLRQAYENFTYSHASIFYNVLQNIPQVSKLVQVGIRDYCQAEVDLIEQSNGRVLPFYDQQIKEDLFQGESFHSICEKIIEKLPQQVYISFDIDGLDPKLCPHTGTPVPGGLDLSQAFYLLKMLTQSGRKIIGFDLCEVAGSFEWDGNVGARLAYKLCNLMGFSQGLV